VAAHLHESDTTGHALRAAGLSVTAPRRVVYQTLAGRERPASAAEVHDLLRAAGSRVGLTTVHRVLRDLADAGLLHGFPGEEQRYRVCAQSPHAHLVCEACGRVIERPADAVRRWLAPAAAEADFAPNPQRTDVYGVCGRCRAAVDSPRRRAGSA
jgi:Fur family transcriptional regulator, ferric uptake regulator